MPMPVIACAVLFSLCALPQQGNKTLTLHVEKSDTFPDLLNKLRVLTKKKIIIDGSVSTQKLNFEGDYVYDSIVTYIREFLDYEYAVMGDVIFLYKAFTKEETRPDYSLAEITSSIKEIKTIVAPLVGGRTGEEPPPVLFADAIKGVGPEESKLLASEGGILIGSLEEARQRKVIEAIYYKEYRPIFFELNRLLTLVNKLDTLAIVKNPKFTQIDFQFEEKDTDKFHYVLSLLDLQNPILKAQTAPEAYSALKDAVATDRPEYSFQLSKELENHRVLAINDARLNTKDVKVISELNRWNFRPDTRLDKTVYSVSPLKPGPNMTPAARILQVLPGSLYRFLMAPIQQSKPQNEIEKRIALSKAKTEVMQRTRRIADSELQAVFEWLSRKPANTAVPCKELPEEIKRKLLNSMLMQSLNRVTDELLTNAIRPNGFILNPEKSYLKFTADKDSPVYTVLGWDGSGFFVRSRTYTRDD